MQPIDAYRRYTALRAHFDPLTPYDVFKHGVRTRASTKAYVSRHDRHVFERIARHKDVGGLILSHIVAGKLTYPGDLVSMDSEAIYRDWKRRRNSLTYVFQEDLSKLKDTWEENLVPYGAYPFVIHAALAGIISIETFVILDRLQHVSQLEVADDFLWPKLRYLSRQYRPFMQLDLPKMRNVFEKKVVDTN